MTPTNVHLTHMVAVTIDADTQGSATPAEDNYKFYTKFQGSGGSQAIFHTDVPGLAAASVFDGWHRYVFDFVFASNGKQDARGRTWWLGGVLANEENFSL